MLNMGFREDIESVLAQIPEERQTVLFSATMPPAILAITKQYQNDPVLVQIQSAHRSGGCHRSVSVQRSHRDARPMRSSCSCCRNSPSLP